MRKVTLFYLAAYLFATPLLYIPSADGRLWDLFVFVCGAGALSYPYFVVSRHTRTGFWKGLGTLLLISVIAQIVEAIVYLIVSSRFLYLDTVALVFIGLILAVSLATEIAWYPIGYGAFWWLYRRKRG